MRENGKLIQVIMVSVSKNHAYGNFCMDMNQSNFIIIIIIQVHSTEMGGKIWGHNTHRHTDKRIDISSLSLLFVVFELSYFYAHSLLTSTSQKIIIM